MKSAFIGCSDGLVLEAERALDQSCVRPALTLLKGWSKPPGSRELLERAPAGRPLRRAKNHIAARRRTWDRGSMRAGQFARGCDRAKILNENSNVGCWQA